MRTAALLALAGTLVATPALADTTVIHAGAVIVDADSAPRGASTITVTDGRIVSITDGFAPGPADAKTVDLKTKTIAPGMIDLHVHLTGDPGGDFWKGAVEPDEWDVVVGAKNARLTALAGFTTVREAGSGPASAFSLRRGTAEGFIDGPRIIAAGPSLAIVGGHGDVSGFRPEVNELLDSGFTCTGAVECAEKVRLASQNGADIIKITATGGVLSDTAAGVERQFFDDELESIVEAAHMMGRQVTAHAHGVTGINAFLEAGGDSIEHGTYLDNDSIRLMRRNGAYLVPTVLAGVTVAELAETADFMTDNQRAKSRAVGPQMLEMARRAHDGGVTIAFGTDSGVSQHGDNAREFELLVEAGLTPMEAIETATIHASRHVRMDSDIGTIETGKYADIVAVDGNPLENISELRDVDFVMKNGTVYLSE